MRLIKNFVEKSKVVYESHASNIPAAAAASLQSCPTLCDPKDCSLTGSSVHGSGVPLTYPINHETNQIKILLISSSVQLV